MDDREIIKRYWNREESAIRESQFKYGRYCFSVADRILCNPEDSEECVNDTWLKAWLAIPPEKPVHLRMFFAKITRNLAFDRYRKGIRAKRGGNETELALEELEECIAAPTEADTAELSHIINRFLASLPERECSIFLRRYFFVESTAEIAKKFSMHESNILVILSRVRRKLKDFLNQEGYSV